MSTIIGLASLGALARKVFGQSCKIWKVIPLQRTEPKWTAVENAAGQEFARMGPESRPAPFSCPTGRRGLCVHGPLSASLGAI